MKFGVNYVPSKGWFYSWVESDVSTTREDFAAIKNIGFDHIRLHLRWDLFQPNPSYYPACHYEKLEKMARAGMGRVEKTSKNSQKC